MSCGRGVTLKGEANDYVGKSFRRKEGRRGGEKDSILVNFLEGKQGGTAALTLLFIAAPAGDARGGGGGGKKSSKNRGEGARKITVAYYMTAHTILKRDPLGGKRRFRMTGGRRRGGAGTGKN